MPFKFDITKTGGYSPGELLEFRVALKFAGDIVQNAYQFKQLIRVKVKFEDLSKDGGGGQILGNGRGILVVEKNGLLYPTSIGKQEYGVQDLITHTDYDIEICFCKKVNWYTGTDKKGNDLQTDMVTIAVHELHHGLGWFGMYIEKEGGENGEPERFVRPEQQLLCFEKYLCFLTEKGTYCPIEPYIIPKVTEMNEEEKINVQVKLARILQSNNVWFCAGGTQTKLFAPTRFLEGSSICHIDIGSEERSVMEPYTQGVQHEIGETTRRIVNCLLNTDLESLPLCNSDEDPAMLPNDEGDLIYFHVPNKTGSATDITALKPTKTIKKTKGKSKGTKTKGKFKPVNIKGQSRAINIVQKTFKEILRLDVHFKVRMQMVDFDSERMQNFTDDEKKSGIVVHHRQNVEVDGVVLPIAVARQIEDPKTIRRRAEHPGYIYDIEIFVDINAEWDYTSTAVSSDGFMGFKSTLLSKLCEAFRFTNCLEYVELTEDKKGHPTFKPIDRKLFLDRDFANVWMSPTPANRNSHGSPARPGRTVGTQRLSGQ